MHPAACPYRCRLCDAVSYRRLTHRGLDGAMQYSGLYRCSGCSVTFSDPVAWREGGQVALVETEANAAPALNPTAEPAGTARGTGHSFATGHIVLPRTPGEPVGYGHSEADIKEIDEAVARANGSKGRRR